MTRPIYIIKLLYLYIIIIIIIISYYHLQPHLFYNLIRHGDDVRLLLPEHHEPLQPVHDAGQSDGLALVNNHLGALRSEGWCGENLDAVRVVLHLSVVIVRIIVVVLLLVGEAWMQKHSIKLIYENSRQNTNCSLTTSEKV